MPHTILIPGLGYDCRIFEKLEIKDAQCLNWIEPQPGEAISQYARRMFEPVRLNGEPTVLIGHSFGGMIAQEIASQFTIDKLILLASVKSRNELPATFRAVAPLGIHRLFSRELSLRTFPLWGSSHGFETAEEQRLFKSMVSSHSNHFLRWALRSLSLWREPDLPQGTDLLHIHGTKDKTFPFHKIRKPVTPIQGGSHIFMYKKVGETTSIIRRFLRQP
ncbi:MAG: alpha/beta fold hydrolase [Bacteroidia bacterium]